MDTNSKTEDFIDQDKGMMNVNLATSERTNSPTVRVNIPTVSDKAKSNKQSPKIRLRRKITVPFVVNAIVIVFALSLLVLLEFGYIPGNQQGFYCQDPQLSYEYKGDVISPLTLGIGCLTLPLIILLLTDVLSKRTFKKINAREIWYYYKECAIGCILVLLLTEVTKILIGEHRPHFLDVCQPDSGKTCSANEYIKTFQCTNPKYSEYFLSDTSRSFPSGHSSLSWFIGTFSAYVVQTRLSTIHTGQLVKPFLIAICFTWSLLCSLTRITDKRHHWWDVLFGTILGIAGAIYSIKLIHKKIFNDTDISKVSTSTTTLVDVKNKDATSVII